jgi:hypothetical protein
MLTTRTTRVDTSKACEQLGHTNTYSLEEGMQLTAEWMRKAYGLLGTEAAWAEPTAIKEGIS